ncbi:MAG TPA: isoprenylcysteine carboxylmethyltransferase family protein [Acetobacteraceae bacterium]|nr:isoprenylcysteine carboxylmethyltransferase family protein [Acetobacteraceae bacterium]
MGKPLLTLMIIVSGVAYWGLAVLGWGGFAAFFAHPPLIALTAVGVVLSGAALFTEGNVSAGERVARDHRWVVATFMVVAPLTGWLPAFTDRIGFWTLDGDAVRWLGVVLWAVGGALRIWPVFALGRRFSGQVAIQPGHTLLTTGIYGAVRNPSYLGLLVQVLGWVLAFRSLAGVVLTALLIPPLIARIRLEEQMLRSQFGAQYDAYCARTARLIPGVY